MNHEIARPMILEALADEGVRAQEDGSHLRVMSGAAREIRIGAGGSSGRSHVDLPVSDVRGFYAERFGGAFVYATGMQGEPVKRVHDEAHAMAAAVNRAVREETGSASAVLLAAHVVSYLDCAGMERVKDDADKERIREVIARGEPDGHEVGCVLMRGSTETTADLCALKRGLDDLWSAYTLTGALPDAELQWHDVRPYMLRAARAAVHERYRAPQS